MAVAGRLPKDTMIETTLNKVVVRMTLETTDHGRALIEALNVAIIPILQMIDARKEPEPDPYLWFQA